MRVQLGDVFSKIKSGDLRTGWIYFRDTKNPTLNTECFLVVSDDDFDSEDGIPSKARLAGYAVEGLDVETINDCLLCAQQFGQAKDASVELESFVYYWRFDAFLPRPGAPEPPPPEIVMMNIDRQFYESLGDEFTANPCRNQGCKRGSIEHSVFCRVHHFESIKKKPCPFSD